jgi:NADPH:quinone reductase
MRAMIVERLGDDPEAMHLADVDLPEPGDGEALIRIRAAGVGPWDVGMRRGAWTGPVPYIPGGEFAGVIVGDTGADAAFDDGAPVYGYPGLSGCYAEYVTCPIEQLAPIPAGLSVIDAAAAPIDVLTAEQGLTDVLSVAAGDRILITAAAGGLGHLAVQIARALGAAVVATASPHNHDFVHKLGAAVVIDHTQPDWPDQVKDATGGGPSKVLACAAPTLEGAAHAARDGATIATPVHAELPAAEHVHWRTYDGEPRGSRLIRLAPWFDDGSLSVQVEARYFLADAAEAHRRAAEGHTRGKIVLIVDEDLAAELEV